MKITRKSILDGKERTLDLNITEDQYRMWEEGMVIQQAMPNLTPAEREFVLTGISEDEWDELFKDDEE